MQAHCRLGAKNLPVEIRLVKDVGIDEAQVSHPNARKGFNDGPSQSSAACHRDASLGKRAALFFSERFDIAKVSLFDGHGGS